MSASLKDRGAAAVEFALIAPLLIGLLIGIVEFSMAMNARSEVTQAAAAAARLYTIELRDGATQADAKTVAETRFAEQVGVAKSDITFEWSCDGPGCIAVDECPNAPSVTPPSIILRVSVPRNSLTGMFHGVAPTLGSKGLALCTYQA